jgi:hypothetical protein
MLCISVYSRRVRVRVYTALSIQNQPPLKIISTKTTCPYIVFSSFCLILFDELRFCMTQKRMFFSGRIYNLLPGSWPTVHCCGWQNHRHGDSVCLQQLQGQTENPKISSFVLFSWAWNSNDFIIKVKLRFSLNYLSLYKENSFFILRLSEFLFVVPNSENQNPRRQGLKDLNGSILSSHSPSWLHFEPLKLLNFDFNAGPDRLPKIMRIRIRNPALAKRRVLSIIPC